MTYFLYKLIPPRPTFAREMDDRERTVMEQHAGYWGELTAAGTALLFGPVADPTGDYGIAIVGADSEADVRALGDADPAVTSGLCSYTVSAMPHTILANQLATTQS